MPDDIFHVDPSDGFVRPKLRVDGVRNLERALSYWVNVSDQETVGAIVIPESEPGIYTDLLRRD